MTSTPPNWKHECASIEELRCITQPGPSVAFTSLCLPGDVHSTVRTWSADDFAKRAPRPHHPAGDHFSVDGFYLEAAHSTAARAELAAQFKQSFPASPISETLADVMADRFTRLASALDRRKLSFIVRSDHRSDDQLHLDIEAEYTAIAYLSNRSTLFANPATLRGHSPHYVQAAGSYDGDRYELNYRMTPEIAAGLEGVPEGSIAVWRGGHTGAAHITPIYQGARAIVLADTPRINAKPALR